MHDKKVTVNNSTFTVQITDTCPHCGKLMEPEQIANYYDSVSKTAALTFRCSIGSCHKFFILEYETTKSPGGYLNSLPRLIEYDYNGFHTPNISDNIKNLSPIFSTTFIEATIAESKSLNNISGIAYRKAFEFLVKDFAAYQNPDRIEDIRKNSLNNVIDMFYKDDMPKIKELLHLTRKIGNDETHYYRQFDAIDITDLKKLIYNFSLYINMILDIEEFSKKTS
ncbi:DUF4145 domain-containing protein [Lactococcus garvieae]|uniref:DUF4145 domain-containing protein n=1 Tax=Lactococcus garvieae TaxID=1363 RepID=UPI00254EFE32|nr:DUF4145 domain-containing protein [Lactococcus garvieae]